ncbi:MAG: hypothetical protein AVDCRST_MAG04-2220, partial [uncultured Acetobacteraceae bacterium]
RRRRAGGPHARRRGAGRRARRAKLGLRPAGDAVRRARRVAAGNQGLGPRAPFLLGGERRGGRRGVLRLGTRGPFRGDLDLVVAGLRRPRLPGNDALGRPRGGDGHGWHADRARRVRVGHVPDRAAALERAGL